MILLSFLVFVQAEDGIRDLVRSRGLGDVYKRQMYEASVEAYYKSLQDQIDYRESYVDNSVDQVENEFVFGSGEAYGLEFFIRKNSGKLNGWIGYTPVSYTHLTLPTSDLV